MPWFRMYGEVLDDAKLARSVRMTGLSKCEILGAWTGLLCLANRSPLRGELWLTEQLPLDDVDIASMLGLEESAWRDVRDAFVALGMLACREGLYVIVQWDKRQFQSDSSTARVRRHRRKKQRDTQQGCNADETLQEQGGNVSVTPPETETETESDTDLVVEDAEDDESLESVPVNGKKEHLQAYSAFEQVTGMPLTQIRAQKVADVVEEMEKHRLGLPRGTPGADVPGDTWVVEAVKIAALKPDINSPFRYAQGILRDWKVRGYKNGRREGQSSNGRSHGPGGQGARDGAQPDERQRRKLETLYRAGTT